MLLYCVLYWLPVSVYGVGELRKVLFHVGGMSAAFRVHAPLDLFNEHGEVIFDDDNIGQVELALIAFRLPLCAVIYNKLWLSVAVHQFFWRGCILFGVKDEEYFFVQHLLNQVFLDKSGIGFKAGFFEAGAHGYYFRSGQQHLVGLDMVVVVHAVFFLENDGIAGSFQKFPNQHCRIPFVYVCLFFDGEFCELNKMFVYHFCRAK